MVVAPVLPANQARGSIYTRGYAIVPDVFSAAECSRIADIAMHVASQQVAQAPSEAFTVDSDDQGRIAPRKIDYPFLKNADFRAFVLDPRLQEVVTLALGQPGYLMRDQLFCKPPQFGTAKPYHQENASVGYTPADDMLITWIALDDATEYNGCLRVVEGSHTRLWPHSPMVGATYNHVPPAEAIDLDREVLLPVDAGGVVLLHSQILHASHPNPTPDWRRAYTAHWVTDRISCTTDAQRYGYSLTAGGGEHCVHRAP
ncbi:MAG: phytanoyl-CoA dioxygenase family protein [Nocardioides sp.]